MNKKSFITGFATAVAAMLLLMTIYFGASGLTELLDSKGIATSEKPYGSAEEKIGEILDYLEDNYYEDVDREVLMERAYLGLVDGLGDPYTTYFTKEETVSFFENINGSYEGIGVVISYGESKDEVIVVSPFEGSPGQKAGLLPGDLILKVDDTKVAGMALEAVVALIKGEKGSEVVLTISRDEAVKEIAITREVIDVPTVYHEEIEEGIGYIQITGFDSITYDQFMEAFNELEGQGADGLVIDLRNNPGGLLHIVAAIADELLPEGLIVYTEDKHGNRQELESGGKESYDKPIVVLVNENSASASEILAGALQDNEKALLVGTTTFGKGLVQQTYNLDDGSSVKITVARYYTPDGNYINEKGIEPDVVVEMPDPPEDAETAETDQDPQLDRAISELKKLIGN